MNGVVEHIERRFAPELEALRKELAEARAEVTRLLRIESAAKRARLFGMVLGFAHDSDECAEFIDALDPCIRHSPIPAAQSATPPSTKRDGFGWSPICDSPRDFPCACGATHVDVDAAGEGGK